MSDSTHTLREHADYTAGRLSPEQVARWEADGFLLLVDDRAVLPFGTISLHRDSIYKEDRDEME